MSVGNELWWSQVQDLHDKEGQGKHYKETELEVFYRLYRIMKDDNMTQGQIRDHFETTFGIGYSAFYTRLRKVGRKYVT